MKRRRKDTVLNHRVIFRSIVFFSFLFVLSMFSIGYAVLTSTNMIKGNVLVKAYTGRIRITAITLDSKTGQAANRYNPSFYSTVGSFGVSLPSLDSTMTYKVTIKNESDTDKMFMGINENVYDNSYVEYEYSGIMVGNVLAPGDVVNINLTFKFRDGLTMVPNNYDLTALLNFEFSNDSFKNLTASIDTVTADFSTGNNIGTFTVTVTNPNAVDVNFSFLLGNTQLKLYDGNNQTEKPTYNIGANETKDFVLYITERDNTVSDKLTITTALNMVTNTPENSTTTVTDAITIRLPNRAKYVILDDNEIVTRDPVFSGVHTDSGLFKSEDGLEGGIIYFYRGDVSNNYVRYAGHYWRILQLDDYMNVRIILDESIGTSGWTNNDVLTSFDQALTTVDYDNSLVKPILENWYQNNIASNANYLSLVRESKFCVDFSNELMTSSGSQNQTYYFGSYIRVGVDASNYAPIFVCPTEYLRAYQVGMLSADEVSFAGGYFNTVNANFYLKTNNITTDVWTISPSYYDPTLQRAGMFLLEKTGRLSDWTSTETLTTARGIRPVITLDGSLIIAGDGTYNNPYIFESEETAG